MGNIQQKMVVVIGCAALIISALLLWGAYLTSKVSDTQHYLAETVEPLNENANEFRFHIVQIQQWLTDISATRALDGLNDGFDMASEHYTQAQQRLKQIKNLNAMLNFNPEIISGNLEQFYQQGQHMAQQYIEGGPALGNKTMADFDFASEKMQESVQMIFEYV